MTHYIDVADMQQLVLHHGVERMMAEMADCIRADFVRWGGCDAFPRAAMACGVLTDAATGYPTLVSEQTITTALRTAATSALVAKALARRNSRSMALIGNGAQSEFQAIAFMTQVGINELRLFDVDHKATDKLVGNLAPYAQRGAVRIVCASSIREAVRGADIVTTATADKVNATILTDDLIEPGMHINAVGCDGPGKTELQPSILLRSKVFVEYEPHARLAGELQQMPEDFQAHAVWKVLARQQPGRDTARQVTLFDSVGFALEDVSALRYIHTLSQKMGIGSTAYLVPALLDAKNLFAFATAARPALRQAA
jgi:ornithine cyclodeaminase